MSKMEAEVRVPPVPDKLTVDLPGVSKGATIGLDKFTTEQLQAIGKEWTDRLIERAIELGNVREPEDVPAEEEAKAPEEETDTPKKARAAKGKKGGHQAN